MHGQLDSEGRKGGTYGMLMSAKQARKRTIRRGSGS